MNSNKEAAQVTVSTDQRSDFSVPAGQTDLGNNGVVVTEEGRRTFIPYDNVVHITYDLEEVEENEQLETVEVPVPKGDGWTKVEVREYMNRIGEEDEEEEFDPEEKQGVESEDGSNEKEPATVTQSFSQSIEEDSLEEDYTVDELSNVILPHIEDVVVLNDAIEVDGRSTAVDEYEDRVEDLRDEEQ